MKVAFLIDHYVGPNAGTERQIQLMAGSLPQVGVGVRMAVFRHSDYTADGSQFPAPVESLGVGRVLSPLSWWRVFRWARRARAEGVAVAHIFFNDAALFAPLALALAGLPSIVARRDMGFWYTRGRLFLLRRMQRFSSAMAANSHAVAEFCGNAEGYLPEKRVVIPNAIAERQTVVRGSGCATFTIGIVANIRPIKRIQDAVHAIADLRASGRDVVLRVVGGGDSRPLRELSDQLGVTDRVEFVGASDQVAAEISCFDAAVLCSESEGLSNAIMEYMQAGLPVVATDTGGNAELVTDGETGFLYPVGDVQQLVDRLQRLVDDHALGAQFGAAGERKVREQYSVVHIARAHAEMYRRFGWNSAQSCADGDRAEPKF
ncbi:MAG: glycosyltransferase [Pseudomonadota bacterium]